MDNIMTNTELIETFMEQYSVVHQVFVIDALHKQADKIIESEKELKETMKRHLISPELWLQVARDWKAFYDKHRKEG